MRNGENKIDFQRYIHLRSENYDTYGITYQSYKANGSKAAPALNQLKKAHSEILTKISSEKVEDSAQIAAISSYMNRMLSNITKENFDAMDNSLSDFEKIKIESIRKKIADNGGRIENNGRVVSDSNEEIVTKYKSVMKRVSSSLEEAKNRRDIQLNTLINRLNLAQSILTESVFMKSNVKKEKLDEIEQKLLKLQAVMDQITSIINKEQNKILKGEDGKYFLDGLAKGGSLVGLKRDKALSHHHEDLMELIKSLALTFNINSNVLTDLQGKLLEELLSVTLEAQSGKAIAEGFNKATKKGEGIDFLGTAHNVLSNFNMNYADENFSYSMTSKTDSVLSFDTGKSLNISGKSYNLFGAQTYGMDLVSDTNLYALLLNEFNSDIVYHYYNILANHEDGDNIDAELKKEAITSLELVSLYYALTGVDFENMSDYFIVNNTKWKEGSGKRFYIYNIKNLIYNIIDRSGKVDQKLFSVKDSTDGELENIALVNDKIGEHSEMLKGMTARTTKVVLDSHKHKITVRMSPKALDDYFNKKTVFKK